jgi:DNA-binding transcriptional ArsR family regulator
MTTSLRWIHTLPEPKDAQTVLDALKAIPAGERLSALSFTGKHSEESTEFHSFLRSLEDKQRLTARIEARIQAYYPRSQKATKSFARAMFSAWTDREAFGESLYQALTTYVENFFREEEQRIIPAQTQALETFRVRAEQNNLLDLLEEVSSGVRMDWAANANQLVLAPSFWGAPFVFFDAREKELGIIVFGARPKNEALVPGELVPDDLVNALKAIADPTRLRILKALYEAPRTPSELAKRLRLRPPTVIHHLHNLRLAGLVQVTISPEAERRYAIRREGVGETTDKLQTFLSGE